jgi:hypothetical protein
LSLFLFLSVSFPVGTDPLRRQVIILIIFDLNLRSCFLVAFLLR